MQKRREKAGGRAPWWRSTGPSVPLPRRSPLPSPRPQAKKSRGATPSPASTPVFLAAKPRCVKVWGWLIGGGGQKVRPSPSIRTHRLETRRLVPQQHLRHAQPVSSALLHTSDGAGGGGRGKTCRHWRSPSRCRATPRFSKRGRPAHASPNHEITPPPSENRLLPARRPVPVRAQRVRILAAPDAVRFVVC